MSDIDEKKLLDGVMRGVSLNKLSEIPSNSTNWFKASADGDVYEFVVDVEAIKQCFIDAGWFIPQDAEFVQQIINYRARTKNDRSIHGVSVVKVPNDNLMTGPEWYEKFIKELDTLEPSSYTPSRNNIVAAAKKAAGIE